MGSCITVCPSLGEVEAGEPEWLNISGSSLSRRRQQGLGVEEHLGRAEGTGFQKEQVH